MSSTKTNYTEQLRVMGHPAGLFVLFFTEMWERFSYYGMRAILVLFLVSAAGIGGWEWSNAEALSLYGLYTGLVYVTPIFGGMIADKLLGYRKAIMLGAFLMTLGHAALALETKWAFYLGLALLILGNGLFKPNISSVVGGLYKKDPEKKDGGYSIFYMGINAGAFLGMMLCGFLGEIVGWSYGFGLAGVFMLVGMIMFYFGQGIFDQIGLKPKKVSFGVKDTYNEIIESKEEEINEGFDEAKVLSEIQTEIPNITEDDKKTLISELKGKFKKRVEGDRLMVIGILAFFTIFFWVAFEQAGGSMTIFASSFTDRILSGSSATIFTVVNTLITIVPLAIITYVLFMLARATVKKFAIMALSLSFSFLIIWGIVGWKVNKELNTVAYDVEFAYDKEITKNDTIFVESLQQTQLVEILSKKEELLNAKDITLIDLHKATDDSKGKDSIKTFYAFSYQYITNTKDTTSIRIDKALNVGDNLYILDVDNKGNYRFLSPEITEGVDQRRDAKVIEIKDKELEVPASWFGVLNSLFIIIFAPLFSVLWASKYNPTAPVKFGIGLILLGLGFAILAFGSMTIPNGAEKAEVSMIFLILAYLLHTLGELTVSPVGLSYVSKLSPAKLVGFMFGIWFLASAIANYIAGMSGSYIDKISEEYGLTVFFLIFTAIPIAAGLAVMAMNKFLLKKMHGIR